MVEQALLAVLTEIVHIVGCMDRVTYGYTSPDVGQELNPNHRGLSPILSYRIVLLSDGPRD
jgi:hypothetical protein